MNWNKPTIALKFNVGINPKTKLPQPQAIRFVSGRMIKYVIAADTPDSIKDESVEPGTALLCLERQTISEGPRGEIIVVEVVDVIKSGTVLFRQGAPGFWWGHGESKGSKIPVHFSVLEKETLKPTESGRWRFEIIGVANPIDNKNTPRFLVKLIEPVIAEVKVAEVAPVIASATNPPPTTERGQRRRSLKAKGEKPSEATKAA